MIVTPTIRVGGFLCVHHIRQGEVLDISGGQFQLAPVPLSWYAFAAVDPGGTLIGGEVSFVDPEDGRGIGVVLRGGVADGVAVVDASLDGFYISAGGSSITKCSAQRSGRAGISIVLGDGVEVVNCTVKDSTGSANTGLVAGISIEAAVGDRVDSCVVRDSDTVGCQEGIRTAGRGTISNIAIENNTVREAGSVGINVSFGSSVAVSNNAVYGGGFGVLASGGSTLVDIDNNSVTGTTRHGIALSRNQGDIQEACNVRRNVVRGSEWSSINLSQIRNSVVTDNNCDGEITRTLTTADSTGNMITNNITGSP